MAESMQAQSKGGPSPEILGWFFVAAGLAFFLLGQALSIALILSARFLKQRKYYLFSFILACLACACFPFGTILRVFTIIVLARPAVKQIYGRGWQTPDVKSVATAMT
jgi:glutathione S-transferase